MRVVAFLGALAVVGFLFVTGKIPGYNSGTTGAKDAGGQAKDAGGQVVHQAGGLSDWYFGHAWAYLALVAGALAVLGVMFWRRIGGFGRGFIMVLGAIAVTVIVTKASH